jgi:hypothetical protein
MIHAICVEIAMPANCFLQAVLVAALGIPYFRWSRRVSGDAQSINAPSGS